MNELKKKEWYLSKTVWGGIVAAVVGVLSMFGVGDIAGEQDTITELIMQTITVISGIVAVYGRITASRGVKTPLKTKNAVLPFICVLGLFVGGCLYADQTTKNVLKQEAIVIAELNKRCQDSNDCSLCKQGLKRAAEYAEKVSTLANGGN